MSELRELTQTSTFVIVPHAYSFGDETAESASGVHEAGTSQTATISSGTDNYISLY